MSKASSPQYTPTKEGPITSPVSPTSPVPKDTGIVVNNRDAAGAATQQPKVRMSMALAALLVYTVGVKYRGINKKERYATEQMFSLSENTANKCLKRQEAAMELIKHNQNHLVRIYPRGTRLRSTNYDPHRYWASGAQLVAMNWQTFGE
jgi:phosphatidylinositol phospholipase C delta